MFSKADKSTTQTTRPAEKPSAPSIISATLHVIGNLVSQGDIQLDGTVDGDVKSKRLTIGETAVINGSIAGDFIRVSGTINGEITGKTVELTQTARVTGDIIHESLSIDAGAFVQGLCKRVESQRLELAATAPKALESGSGKPKLAVTDGGDNKQEKKAAV